MRLGLCFILILIGFLAQARTFSTSDTFAVYVRGGLDPASVENTLVSDSKGNGVTLNAKHPYKVSGELGLFFAHPIINVRAGLEFIRPLEIEDVNGARASDDVSMYTLKSELLVLAPKVSLETNMMIWPTARLFMSGGYGYAMLTGRNSYTMTAAGTTQFGGLTDFKEELTGVSALYEATIGYENLLADTTTFVIEAGYRSLVFDSIEYKTATRNFQGNMNSGQPALNMDGKKRSIDLSGSYAALSFRFWL